MTQLESGSDCLKKERGVKKGKKLSTRVDMTPMVDLGFLLNTFFIFTTTMSNPRAMNLNMPGDSLDTPTKESGALTILLGKDNGVYYYEGQLLPGGYNIKSAGFATIREEIINKKNNVMKIHMHDANCPGVWAKSGGDKNSCLDRDFVVVIKPDQDATYKNTVDILDEMKINNVKRYAMVNITPKEDEVIHVMEVHSEK